MAKKLLVDMDGVIADFYTEFATYLNQHYGTTLSTAHEPPAYDFDEWGGGVDGVDVEAATRKWIRSGGYRRLPIYPGAADFLNALYGLFDVSVVTARVGTFWGNESPVIERKVKQDTIDWFKDNGLTAPKLYFDHDKIGFCAKQDIGIMVEDKLETAIKGAKAGLNTVLIDRYWNQSPPRLKVFRAHSYTQALKHLRILANKR